MNKHKIHPVVEKSDTALRVIASTIKGLHHYLEPTNYTVERYRFLSQQKTPQFTYRSLKHDPKRVSESIKSISLPKSAPWSELLKDKRDQLETVNHVIAHRNKSHHVITGMKRLYGSTSSQLVSSAKSIVQKENKASDDKRDQSPQALANSFKSRLDHYKIGDWRTKFYSSPIVRVKPKNKIIGIPKKRKFSKNEIKRIVIHETDAHVLRAANGHLQPLSIFVSGLPGYLETEEGIAAYLEEVHGVTDHERFRTYAGRVIAVDTVINGAEFVDTFKTLTTLGFSPHQSWDLSFRAHRGGGFIKDHVYLKGYLLVKKFATQNRDFSLLYSGKIGLKNLGIIKSLRQQNIISSPKYFPRVFTQI